MTLCVAYTRGRHRTWRSQRHGRRGAQVGIPGLDQPQVEWQRTEGDRVARSDDGLRDRHVVHDDAVCCPKIDDSIASAAQDVQAGMASRNARVVRVEAGLAGRVAADEDADGLGADGNTCAALAAEARCPAVGVAAGSALHGGTSACASAVADATVARMDLDSDVKIGVRRPIVDPGSDQLREKKRSRGTWPSAALGRPTEIPAGDAVSQGERRGQAMGDWRRWRVFHVAHWRRR